MLKTKKQFMKHLVRQLKWRCSRSEYNEVVNDYETFFNDGYLQGKSETELCNEFGDPKNIMVSLDNELKFKPSLLRYVQNFLFDEVSAANLFYLGVIFYIVNTPFSNTKGIITALSSLLVLITLLNRLSKVNKPTIFSSSRRTINIMGWPSLLLILSTVSTLTIFIVLTQLVKGDTLYIPLGIRGDLIGPVTAAVLNGLVILQIISILLSYYNLNKWSSFYRIALIQYYAVILSCFLIINHLRWLEDISKYTIGILLSTFPLALFLVVLYLRHFFKTPLKGE